MTEDDFERLNTLADKALNDSATNNELSEFNQLLTLWNESAEFNLYSGHHWHQRTPKRQK
ncbi:MAG: hypothetical protein ACI843_001320 [Psychrobacter glaciei]|jgi:hypothetical protein